MGFGYLFIGFLLTLSVPFHAYTDVFSTALMLYGLSGLISYAQGFKNAFRVGIPTLAVNFVSFLFAILSLLNLAVFPWLISALKMLSIIMKAAFYWLLFLGIEEIAKQVDITKLRAHGLRSRFLTPVFCAMGLFLEMNIFEFFNSFLQYYLLGYLLFGIIYAFLNAKLLYECYILICYEGDESMELPPSKTPFWKNKKQ